MAAAKKSTNRPVADAGSVVQDWERKAAFMREVDATHATWSPEGQLLSLTFTSALILGETLAKEGA